MQAKGVKVTGMLGGAAPGSYDCLAPGADKFDTYYPILRDTFKKYNLAGIDLDVEQSVPLEDIENLITQLRTDFGDSDDQFALTLAPVASALLEEGNLSGFDYVTLEKEAGSKISWYNAQFYSGFGSVFPDDQYINITQYHGGIFHPRRLVAGVLTNGDDGSGYVPPDEVVKSVKDLCKRFGGEDAFGGVAGWEYFNSLPEEGKPWEWAELMKNTMEGGGGGGFEKKKGGGDGDGDGDNLLGWAGLRRDVELEVSAGVDVKLKKWALKEIGMKGGMTAKLSTERASRRPRNRLRPSTNRHRRRLPIFES